MNERRNHHDSQSIVVCRNFFGLWRLKHLKLRITCRQRRSNFSRRLYKKWLITQNYVFLNKYKLYCNTIAIINKIYRDRLYNDILVKSDNTKKMRDDINLLINKKRPSSNFLNLIRVQPLNSLINKNNFVSNESLKERYSYYWKVSIQSCSSF